MRKIINIAFLVITVLLGLFIYAQYQTGYEPAVRLVEDTEQFIHNKWEEDFKCPYCSATIEDKEGYSSMNLMRIMHHDEGCIYKLIKK